MFSWPDIGTRVTVRYRRAAGSVPPLTDAVGHLLAVEPVVRVRTKTGAIVEFPPADVVALRVLTDAPVRTSDIRALEHAAAAAWPGAERTWLDGWLLRAGQVTSIATNCAVPLGISARLTTVPAIVDWYERRGLTPWLAIPDRLLALPPDAPGEHTERVLVRDVSATGQPEPAITFSARPDDAWFRIHGNDIPAGLLTAVVDGELMFGTHAGAAVARAAVTDAPDGARWVGLSELRATDDRAAAALCEALLAWGAGCGATRGYLVAGDDGASALIESLGFRPHHRRRYFPARRGSWDTV
jgi:N-acetylglutamate synthase